MISDIIYAGDDKTYEEIKKEILASYPEAKFEDASDDIHGARFAVDIEKIELEDWYNFVAFGLRAIDLSFVFSLNLTQNEIVSLDPIAKKLTWRKRVK
jgi:hypothetical protein